MVKYNSINKLKENGVYNLALKSGLISPSLHNKVRVYDFYTNCNKPTNKERIQETAVQLQLDPNYIYKSILYIKNN